MRETWLRWTRGRSFVPRTADRLLESFELELYGQQG